jgi:hypothetical protein
MRHVSFVTLLVIFTITANAQTTTSNTSALKQVNVAVDKEVELIFTVANLTSLYKNDLNGMRGGYPHIDRLIRPLMLPFKKFEKHPAVIKLDFLIRENNDLLFNLPGIALNIPSFPYNVGNYQPSKLGQVDTTLNLKDFFVLLNDFYKASKFDNQFQNNRPIYEAIEKEVKAKLPDPRVVSEMEKYYGKTFASYNLTPSPLFYNGINMGFGETRKDAEGTHIHMIHSTFAPADIDSVKILKPNVFFGFGVEGPLREKAIHEFGHSFVNPTIHDNVKYRPAIDSLSYLFTNALLDGMSWQGYPEWRNCLVEHCVRTGEVRIAERLGLKEDAERLMKYHTIDRKFIYIPLLLEAYKKAERDPNVECYEDFAPYIIKALSVAIKSNK